VRFGQFDGFEWPDPLTSCQGFKPPTGLPLSVQLGSFVKATLTDASVTVNGASIPVCGIDSTNYVNPESQNTAIRPQRTSAIRRRDHYPAYAHTAGRDVQGIGLGERPPI
jgi:hypothetical protein